MKNIYIYPNSAKGSEAAYNPYKDDLVEQLKLNFNIVNLNSPTTRGVFDIFDYVGRIDALYLNWIENIPEKKMGGIQSLIFILLFFYCKIKGIKVVWTMHNKFSHNNKGYLLKKVLMRLLIKRSDIIFTHSSEGVRFAKQDFKRKNEICFYHHPIKDRRTEKNQEKIYDIFIWGNLVPHKDVDKFLDFLYCNGLEKKYSVLIIGKVFLADYEKKLMSYANENIRIENRFVEFSELENICGQSRIVLFTYHESTILSSGVLIDSLSFGAKVVGPNVAAFADLEKEGVVETYDSYTDIVGIVEKQKDEGNFFITNRLDDFIVGNSWYKITNKISKQINAIID